MKALLRKVAFWTFWIGTAIGLYVGYQIGTIRGYERAMSMIQEVIQR